MILSVDPGSSTGAAVLLDERRAGVSPTGILGCFTWKPGPARKPGLVFRGAFGSGAEAAARVDRLIGQSRIATGHELGLVIAYALRSRGFTRCRLVVEDVYVGQNAATAIGLARWSGAFAGALESIAIGPVEYVRADEWRAGAFGIRRATKREVAKAETLARLPAGSRSELDGFGEVGGLEHLVDALGLGLWADGLRVEPPPRVKKPRGRKECSTT